MTDTIARPARSVAVSHAAAAIRPWTILALVLLVALVYWPGLGGGFVFDDYANIIDNAPLHVTWQSSWPEWLAAAFSSPASDLQRPLAMLTFAFNHAMTGLDPYWMKLTNVCIHLLNTWLVFALARRLLRIATPAHATDSRNSWIALWVAAAWALNPINLTAVLLVVQRMEILCHSFVLAGLWLYVAGRMRQAGGKPGWLLIVAGIIGGTALGTLCKESAVLLPVYALALEWALLRFVTRSHATDWRLPGFFAITLAAPAVIGLSWLLPRVSAPGAFAGRGFDLVERLLTEARVLVDYLHWTLLPNLSRLALHHDDYPVSHGLLNPPSTLLSLLLLGGLLGVAVWLRKRRPLAALGLAWFACAHLLTATVIPLELVFEHRNYFASLGLCLVLADLLLRLPTTRSMQKAGMTVAVLLLLLYTGTTALRSLEWSNPLRFSLAEAAKHPESPRATYALARNYVILGYLEPGSAHADRALPALIHAMQAPGANPLPESAAITFAQRTGRPIDPQWWRSLQHKLRTQPIGPQQNGALGTLVQCQLNQNCQLPEQQMVASFQAALDNTRHPETLNIYGNYALNALDDPNLALRLWMEAARRNPAEVQYQKTVARMLIASGHYDLAEQRIAHIRQMGRLGQNKAHAQELAQQLSRAKAANSGPLGGSAN